jgi:hypothetical protein
MCPQPDDAKTLPDHPSDRIAVIFALSERRVTEILRLEAMIFRIRPHSFDNSLV